MAKKCSRAHSAAIPTVALSVVEDMELMVNQMGVGASIVLLKAVVSMEPQCVAA
jgi:hypothetical protein